MTLATENQSVIPVHMWRGIASCIIGVTSVMITLLLAGITMSGTEPPRPVMTALQALSTAMLCANLIGVALGFLGTRDRASRKLYPLLGLALNVAIPATFVLLALVGLSMDAP
jgi:Na+/H+-translocating membrane pyrophosphatase